MRLELYGSIVVAESVTFKFMVPELLCGSDREIPKSVPGSDSDNPAVFGSEIRTRIRFRSCFGVTGIWYPHTPGTASPVNRYPVVPRVGREESIDCPCNKCSESNVTARLVHVTKPKH